MRGKYFIAAGALWFFGGALLLAYLAHVSQRWWGEYWLINNWWGLPILLPFIALWFFGSIGLIATGCIRNNW
jgi:hypothetical protein